VTRLTGASKNTVSKLLVDAGRACGAYQDRVPAGEFRGTKFGVSFGSSTTTWRGAKVVSADARDVWTWIGLDADTKLICSFSLGIAATVPHGWR
jgi:hypothetical protein